MMDYIKGTHIINTFYRNIVNLPKNLINILLFICQSKKRVEFKHSIFKHEFKLNFFPFETFKK